MGSSIENRLTEWVSTLDRKADPDTFFGWDQLILLAMPFPIMLVAEVAYILWDNNTANSIRALYITPLFVVSLSSFFIVPILVIAALLFLIGRNLFLRRLKRLILYAVVLVVLPATMKMIDGDYLRFVLQEAKFKVQQKQRTMPQHSAYCFVFDHIEDNFYFGGMNFLPFEKLILYVSDDLVGQETPRIDTLLSDGRCPSDKSVQHVRHLKGRFYLAHASEQ